MNQRTASRLAWGLFLLGVAVFSVAAWLSLKSEGLYLATNPTSSFFYVLTAVHALHVLGRTRRLN